MTPAEHRELAERVCEVLAGDAKGLIRDVTEQMTAAAEREDFEAAARARDRLTALRSVLERNAMVLGPGTDVDVFSVVDEEMEAAAHVFVVRDGRIAGQRGWVVDKPDPLSTAELTEQLLQEAYGGRRRGRHSHGNRRARVGARRGLAMAQRRQGSAG